MSSRTSADEASPTLLLRRAEQLVRDRGCSRTTLAVEEDNVGALRLYRRMGYQEYGAEDAEWDQEAPDGTTYRYRCRCLLMQRTLSEPREHPVGDSSVQAGDGSAG